MPLFIDEQLESKTRFFTLSRGESQHLIKVLRKAVGDAVYFTNGKGLWVEGVIQSADPLRATVAVRSYREAFQARPYVLHLAVAPPKPASRFEWLLEKATEIGVDTITPLCCAHSEHRTLRLERLKKVIHAAVKQSLKAYIPELRSPLPFSRFVTQCDSALVRRIAHLQSGPLSPLVQTVKPGDKVVLLIGPEGDFSPDEVALALENDFLAVRLGNSRLRTETAALYAAAALSLCNA